MRARVSVSVLLLMVVVSARAQGNRYLFYREQGTRRSESGGGAAPARRVFGGAAARLGAWPGACALLDAATAPRCSCGALTAHWALTAAHCIAPHVVHVRHSAEAAHLPPLVDVIMLYKHPE